MEQFDSERAKRVWQRVQSGTTPQQQENQQTLHGLIQRELSDGAVYQQLLRKLQGREHNAIRQLYEQRMRNAAILRGICALADGTVPALTPYPAADAPAAVLLRRCYGRQMQSLAEYENRKTDPLYGKVFQQLAQQELLSCCTLLELLGREQKKNSGAAQKHY